VAACLAAMLLALGIARPDPAAASNINLSADGKLFFTTIVGKYQVDNGQRKVLLRWYTTDGTNPFEVYQLYRKDGGPFSPNPYTRIARVSELRADKSIRAVFEAHGDLTAGGSNPLLDDLFSILDRISDTPATTNNYPDLLRLTLDAAKNDEYTGFRARQLVNVNYGVALVQGLGYLDLMVAPGTYTYQLRALHQGKELVIGRLSIDTTNPTQLPPPGLLTEVEQDGLIGDRRVYLRWAPTVPLLQKMPLMFGYNVYRADGWQNITNEAAFLSALDAGTIEQINTSPVIIASTEEDDDLGTNTYFFCDDNGALDLRTGAKHNELRFGYASNYTYWAAARDLMGQRGRAGPPLFITIADRLAPLAPRSVRVHTVSAGGQDRLRVRWKTNADRPNVDYVDDTDHYAVYRARDFRDADTPTATLIGQVPHVPGSGHTSLIDTGIDLATNAGETYWYTVVAIDAATNRSPFSVPARGVLYDYRGPDAPRPDRLTVYRCDFTVQDCSYWLDTTTNRLPTVNIEVWRMTNELVRVIVHAMGRDGKPRLVGDESYPPGDDWVYFKDAYISGHDLDSALYTFEFVHKSGTVSDPYECGIDNGLRYPGEPEDPVRFKKGTLGLEVGVDCHSHSVSQGAPPTILVHDPVVTDPLTPITIEFSKTNDHYGIRFYQSMDCKDYLFVSETDYGSNDTIVVTNFFHPAVAQRLCFGFKTYDRNHNLSAMQFLTPLVVAGSAPPAPTIVGVTEAGTVDAPKADLTFASLSPESIQSFDFVVSYTSGVDAEDEEVVEFLSFSKPSASLSYNGGVYSYTLTGIGLNTNYLIQLYATDIASKKSDASETKEFMWSYSNAYSDLSWPLREAVLRNTNLLVIVSNNVCNILLGKHDTEGQETMYLTNLTIRPPFVVYRRSRTDTTWSHYYQVSPLIPHIPFKRVAEDLVNGEEGLLLSNDYICVHSGLDRIDRFYYMDDYGLRSKVQYQHIVLKYGQDGELERSYGPGNVVTIP